MGGLYQDLKQGLRILTRNPGFTSAAVLSLALGIGANAGIFSVVNGLLLKPLPVAEPDRLVTIYTGFDRGSQYSVTSYPDYLDIRDRVDAFSDVAAYFLMPMSVKGPDRPEVVMGFVVTSNYFDVLGVEPRLGRTFISEKERSEDDAPVVIVSHGFWQRRFGSDPELPGKTILVNSTPFTVIGVAPPGFTSTSTGLAPDVWIPLLMAPRILPLEFDIHKRYERWLRMKGRLEVGVSFSQARAAVAIMESALRNEYPDTNDDVRLTVVEAEQSRIVGNRDRDVGAVMGILMVLVGLVLVIACSNVANLLLARAVDREREIAMRTALGAGRWRIIRQLLTENMLLCMLAGAAGILLADWAMSLVFLIDVPSQFPIDLEFGLDRSVLGFGLGISLLAGLLLSLLPGLRAGSSDLSLSLKNQRSGTAGGSRKSRLQAGLVIVQVSLSFMLLISAGLVMKSMVHMIREDPGFNVGNTLVLDMNLTHAQYDETRGRSFYDRLVRRVESLPGVELASIAYMPPFPLGTDTFSLSVEGYEPAEDERMTFYGNYVDPQYFTTMEIPISRGRAFEERDKEDTPLSVVVNETMARRFWSGEDPVGRGVRVRGRQAQVIGIARDVKYLELDEDPRPYLYLSIRQRHVAMSSLHVRTSVDPRTLMPQIVRTVEELDPNLPVNIRTMSEQVRSRHILGFLAAASVALFGLLALALALVGVYGVTSHSVRQRVHEFGIRTALGAGRVEILRLVLNRGMVLAAFGIGLGLIASFFVSGALSGFLYGVSPLDPVIFAGVSLVLASAVLMASYMPARWAASVDPSMALHYE